MLGVVRPAADIVIPVAGTRARVEEVVTRFGRLTLRDGDTLTVVDNRGVGAAGAVVAADVHTSYHARNAGAARGVAPWIVFLDADVEAPAGLLDALLGGDPIPDDVGVIAGGIIDTLPADGAGLAVRYAHASAALSHTTVVDGRGEWAFAQTANAAVRRSVFETLGGFREDVRSGGDADLCFRARAAGFQLLVRGDAAVRHASRDTVRGVLGNRFRHGTGAGWLQSEHPGSMPPRRWPGLILWGVRRFGAGLAAGVRGDRDGFAKGVLDGPAVWAFELGRRVPNRELRRRRR